MELDILTNNPVFQKMSKEKKKFISSFYQCEKPKNVNQALPFLMKYKALAQKKQIHFDKSESELLVKILCQSLPEQERIKVEKALRLLH